MYPVVRTLKVRIKNMKIKAPLISFVIVNFNYGRFLEAAIQSIISQCTECIELIVIDGGSTDNSLDVIKKYEDRISYWVSEPDNGQSDAFNKGFAKAKGKYLSWLNADDVLMPECLSKVIKEMNRHPECEWFTGNYFKFTPDGSVVKIGWGPHYLPFCLQRKGWPISVYGPTSFFAKELFDRVGGMNVNLHLMMDIDLWVRFILAGAKQRRVNCFCWAFRMHEASKTASYEGHVLSDEKRARFRIEDQISYGNAGYKPSKLIHWLIKIWRVLDGSALKNFFLRMVYKRIDIGKMG